MRDAGFFLLEAERLRAVAATFAPSFSRSFEECTASLAACIDDIYRTLDLPLRSHRSGAPAGPRQPMITPPRVTSTLDLVRNRAAVEALMRDVAAGNWTPGPPQPG